MNHSAPCTRLSVAARRGLRRWRRTHDSRYRVAVVQTGTTSYEVVGTGTICEAYPSASSAIRMALRRPCRARRLTVPLDYVASRAE